MEKLSIVVSVYNEEAVLDRFYTELMTTTATLPCPMELLFVDDGSQDRSGAIIDSLAAKDSQVRAIHFSRNFGHEAAMIAGIDHAYGDVVACMDADLQNPPSVLLPMVVQHRQGADIVLAVREDRADGGFVKRWCGKLVYQLIDRLSGTHLIPSASDFFLVSRQVAEVLRHDYRERSRFLRGIIQNVGFNVSTVTYNAPARAAGHSHYSVAKLTRLAFTSIASFSNAPLKAGIYGGLLFGLISLALIVYSIVMWIIARPIGGYTTLIIFLSAFAAILLIVIGIIGYYIGLLLDETKGRPIYILKNITETNNDE